MTSTTTKVTERTCAHLLCMTTVVGPEGALCWPCLMAEARGDATEFTPSNYCPCCDNDSEDAL